MPNGKTFVSGEQYMIVLSDWSGTGFDEPTDSLLIGVCDDSTDSLSSNYRPDIALFPRYDMNDVFTGWTKDASSVIFTFKWNC